MAKQVGKKFVWVIKNFASLQCEDCYSVPVLIGDCKWRLCAYPRGEEDDSDDENNENVDYLSLFLQVADCESLPSGWRRYVNFRLSIVNLSWSEHSKHREAHGRFDQNASSWGFPKMIPRTKILDEEEGFLEDGELMIVAEVDVLEAVGTLDESDKASNHLKKRKLNDDVVESSDTLKAASSVKESIDVNGFHVLPSQVESVKRIFERHPDIAVEFRAKNQYLRNACMNSLLSVIETLCQSVQELSNEDLVVADNALTYVKDAGFKVDWLEKKLVQVKEKKERELSALAWLQKTEEVLLKMKGKCTEPNVLVEEQKAELSATRIPLSFDDVV